MSRMEYLPMPLEAMFAPDLTLSDLRVLAAIAFHDRRGANGAGCYATVTTLAKLAGCNTRTVKRSTDRLREAGYIRSERSDTDRRKQVNRVVYDSDLTSKKGGGTTPDSNEDRGPRRPQSGAKPDANTNENHGLNGHKQSHNQIPRIGEANSGEPAPFLQNGASLNGETDPRVWVKYLRGGGSVGHYMSVTQRLMKAMSYEERSAHADLMFQIQDASTHGETEYHWAERLMNELSFLNDEASYDEAHSHDR